MRNIFSSWITSKAIDDKSIILIVNDIGFETFDNFRMKCPDRFFNFGVCEQSMIGASAGMALSGLKPYVFGITPFVCERPFEQLKIDVGLNHANVKIIGYDDYPTQGSTHAMMDEGRYMQSFKTIDSYFPTTKEDVINSLDTSYNKENPTFIRLKKL